MIIPSLALIGGWAFCLGLLSVFALLSAKLKISRRARGFFTHTACASLVGAFWLSRAMPNWPVHGAMFIAGFLSAPFCTLPVYQRLSCRVEGLTRAASGLGAGPRMRMRLLWFPLLRGPMLLSGLISLATLGFCLALGRIAHV